MKALTLTQPWATLVAVKAKQVETRSWKVSHRGQFAIHAAKGFPKACRDLCYSDPFNSVLLSHLRENKGGNFYLDDVFVFPFGAVVAVAQLKNIRPTDFIQTGLQISHQEFAFGDYTAGRYAWELENIIALPKPVPCRGFQGLWNLPVDVEREVLKQIKA